MRKNGKTTLMEILYFNIIIKGAIMMNQTGWGTKFAMAARIQELKPFIKDLAVEQVQLTGSGKSWIASSKSTRSLKRQQLLFKRQL